MKYIAVLLLFSVSVCVVLAFPGDRNAVTNLSVGGLHANTIARGGDGGTGRDASAASAPAKLRMPRHLLKKWFYSKPQVVVQPILVEPHSYPSSYNPYVGVGRGYGYGGGGNSIYSPIRY